MRTDAGRLPMETVLVAGAGIFDALAYIKTVGIIHRDVKPANVLIVVRGRQLDKVLHPVQAVQLEASTRSCLQTSEKPRR